jgi:DNA gyrase/topoisomerase IV subunit A
MSVFDNAVSSPSTTMKASPAAPDKAASAAATRAAAVAAARAELEKVLQHAHSTMMVQLKARVAMDQARLAVAEKQRLEQEQRREQQLQQAKEAAINKYRDSIKRLMYAMEELPAMLGLDDMSSLSSAHKVSTQPECEVDETYWYKRQAQLLVWQC